MACTNPGLNTWAARVSAAHRRLVDLPGRGLVRPLRHLGARRHDQGAGRRRHRADARGGRPRARAGPRRGPPHRGAAGRALRRRRSACATPPARPPCGSRPAPTRSVERELAARPLREYVTPSADLPLLVERELALSGAWYELFPRSEGATYDEKEHRWTTGTLRTAAKRPARHRRDGLRRRLPHPGAPDRPGGQEGPEQHPRRPPRGPRQPLRDRLGRRRPRRHPPRPGHLRRTSTPSSPSPAGSAWRSPWTSRCSAPPTTPGCKTHPEWFTTRADGTIAYAENPPKKYQDIYPLNFDNDPAGIYAEVRRVVQVWIDHGVTLFRVDNPHTKPVEFWQWLIADVAKDHPEVIWLAEAFTQPAMMHTLGKVGFQQSYTYYTWRNSAARPARVPHRAVRRRRGLHAPVVLADDARHPHAVHAVRRPGRLEAAGGARRHPRADLRHLRRLRADGARGPARRRGADRQREVRVQEPALGRLRARRQQGRAARWPAGSP